MQLGHHVGSELGPGIGQELPRLLDIEREFPGADLEHVTANAATCQVQPDLAATGRPDG